MSTRPDTHATHALNTLFIIGPGGCGGGAGTTSGGDDEAWIGEVGRGDAAVLVLGAGECDGDGVIAAAPRRSTRKNVATRSGNILTPQRCREGDVRIDVCVAGGIERVSEEV